MRLQDTLTNSEKELESPQKIRIYLCGVTVYDESHIGHARTIIVFDVLRRYLENKNISVNFIQKLIEKEIAYVSENGVYFSVSKFPEYGKLSKKHIDELQSGARIEVDEAKRDPLDFALWKFSDIAPTWESPWGNGRPGWHIECSAMSIKYLGENFDIHGGGRDLIFPHHENEIAQSESFTEKQFAKIWMHVGMVTIKGEKMSKSLGNIKSIKYVLDNWGPNIIRLFCLSGHYSKPIDYSEELLKENLIKWRQVETAYYELIHSLGTNNEENITEIIRKLSKDFDNALEDDFNTHLATSAFFSLVKETNRLAANESLGKTESEIITPEFERMMNILGINIPKISQEQKNEIDKMIQNREKLRKEKQFVEADKIRDILNEMNIELIDHKGKTIWMKKERIKTDL